MALAKATPERLYELIQRVRPLSLLLYRAVEANLEGTGLTVADRAVLEHLHQKGAVAVPELAAALDLPRQPVQRSVDALLEAGYVARKPNPRNQRSPLLAVTAEGRKLLTRVLAKEAKVSAAVAQDLAAADLEAAMRVVDAMLAGYAAKG